ncbi:MAG: phosphate ABC transporter permease PstA [Pseudomonadota bacterium]
MTDVSTPSDPMRAKQLKRRHDAERRFKLYGQMAIGLAVSFLAMLLLSIGSKAIGAFSRHSLTLPLEAIERPVDGPPTVTQINLAVRTALVETLPQASEDRLERAEIYSLTTRLAVLPLQRQLAANPALADRPITVKLALSDDLDLYLKNEAAAHRINELGQAGRFIETETGRFRLTDAGLDGFVDLRERIGRAEGQDLDILVSFNGAWFDLVEITGAALVLSHLAGPVPDLGEQTAQSIQAIALETPGMDRKVSNRQIAIALYLKDQGLITRAFNTELFVNADSTYPELAGAAAALFGSIFTMLITALFALPIGILAAVYLEEFAEKSVLTSIIEVNINNLAAVPSIIFGLLGAAVFLNTFDLPRSVPLVGGLVLGLLVLPTIIIASRAALRAVPPSVRDAALGLGASPSQAVFHHVLPLAAPGILTGAIIAMARALGETAPLLLIGMVAFISEVPTSPNDEATVLPVLIYKWFSGAERAWEPMTAAVIILLLTVLVAMNLVATLLRRRFEQRW